MSDLCTDPSCPAAEIPNHAHISPADQQELLRVVVEAMSDQPTYVSGGYVPRPSEVLCLDPEECVIRAADVRAGRLVCCRASHAGRDCHRADETREEP